MKKLVTVTLLSLSLSGNSFATGHAHNGLDDIEKQMVQNIFPKITPEELDAFEQGVIQERNNLVSRAGPDQYVPLDLDPIPEEDAE